MQEYKILLIDDEPEIIRTIFTFLSSDNPNYILYHANRAATGLEIANEIVPDLILTDWDMPEIDGIQLIKTLKAEELTEEIPIVMISGKMTASENLKEALEAGAIDYIRKPIDQIELVARVNSMLQLADSYKANLAMKNHELSVTAMNILKAEQQKAELLKKLMKLQGLIKRNAPDLQPDVAEIVHAVSFDMKNNSWNQFEEYFSKTNPQFYRSLALEFPDLSPVDLKVAMLMRMQLSSKDMSDIMYISEQSVKTARSRLRKKLGLERSQNLAVFLQKF